jgi:uroporphyrinogen-III decarboxylase
MGVMRPDRHIPVVVNFSHKWMNAKFDIRYDEDHMGNPDYQIKKDIKTQRELYKYYGHLGIGQKAPEVSPVVRGFGITTIAQLFGCKVIFQDDEAPYAVPLNLSDDEIMHLEPIREFKDLFPMNLHLEQADYLVRKYGKAKISIGYQGILSTAIKLRGEQLFVDFFEKPEIAKKVLDISYQTTENLRQFILQVNAKNGYPQPDQIYLVNCAIQLISPKIYEKYLLPYDLAFAQKYAPNFGIHHCGNNMDAFSQLYGTLPKGTYYDIGYGSNVKKCVEQFRTEQVNQLIRGRFGPDRLLYADIDEIQKEIKRIVESDVNCVACVGVDPLTPDKNLEAYFQSVWRYGRL